MNYVMHKANILDWARDYDGPLFHAAFMDAPLGAPGALDFGVGATMARIAECYQIGEIVCFFVALQSEQAERLDMVNRRAGSAALLACVIIALQRFTPLCLPIWAAIAIASINVLRVVQSMPVLIAAGTRAIFATSLRARFVQSTFPYFEQLPAIKALVLFRRWGWPRLNGRVLTFPGAMLSAAMFRAAGLSCECFSAVPANVINLTRWRRVGWFLANVPNSHTGRRTVLRLVGSIWLDLERLPAGPAR